VKHLVKDKAGNWMNLVGFSAPEKFVEESDEAWRETVFSGRTEILRHLMIEWLMNRS